MFAAGESLAQSSTAEPGAPEAKSFHATPTNTPPEIDGVLDDPVWADREPITDLHQIDPVEYAGRVIWGFEFCRDEPDLR